MKYNRLHLMSELYYCNEKLSFSFSFFKASIIQLHINFTTLESFFSYLAFQKEIAIFPFSYIVSEK